MTFAALHCESKDYLITGEIIHGLASDINAGMNDLRSATLRDPANYQALVFGIMRVIEDQITTLRPYNARYTGDNRSIFRKSYMEIITRVLSHLHRITWHGDQHGAWVSSWPGGRSQVRGMPVR